MKVRASIGSAKKRFLDCKVVVRRNRKGKKRMFVLSKNGRAKTRQG